jgi:hypothetical protein
MAEGLGGKRKRLLIGLAVGKRQGTGAVQKLAQKADAPLEGEAPWNAGFNVKTSDIKKIDKVNCVIYSNRERIPVFGVRDGNLEVVL